MSQETLKLFKDLTELGAGPGYEHNVRRYMREELGKYSDELIQDRLGSIFAVKKGTNPNGLRIMIAGHMDEVAFLVTGITKNGMIRFETLGGWWEQNMLSQRINVHTDNGLILGVIGSVSPHLLTDEQRKKPMEIKNMLIDIGATSEENAKELGIKIGQLITPVSTFEVLANGKRLIGKAFDNRYGCVMAIEVLKELQNISLESTLYIGATVQEEVGLRGATTSANLIKPHLFFGADASPARDESGDESSAGHLGKGPLLRILDRTMVTHGGIREYVRNLAETNNIPYQYYTSPGGTDAGAVHISNQGVPSTIIGIPARYIHCHNSIIDLDDYLNAKKLMIEMIKNMDLETYNNLIK